MWFTFALNDTHAILFLPAPVCLLDVMQPFFITFHNGATQSHGTVVGTQSRLKTFDPPMLHRKVAMPTYSFITDRRSPCIVAFLCD